jgi:hypothetical protein
MNQLNKIKGGKNGTFWCGDGNFLVSASSVKSCVGCVGVVFAGAGYLVGCKKIV